MTICPKCGKELKENAIRCIHCGNYLDEDLKEENNEEILKDDSDEDLDEEDEEEVEDNSDGSNSRPLMKIITKVLMVIGGVAVLALALGIILLISANSGIISPQTSGSSSNNLPPVSQFLTYENQSLGYKINYPSSWSYQALTESEATKATFDNTDGTLEASVISMDLTGDFTRTSVDDLTTIGLRNFNDPSTNPNSRIIRNNQSILSGNYAREVEVSEIRGDGKNTHSIIRFTKTREKLYILLFSAYDENFKSNSSIAQAMFDSFTIDKTIPANQDPIGSNCLVNFDEKGAITKWNLLWNPPYVWEDGSRTSYQNDALLILDKPTTGATFQTLNKQFDNFVVAVDSTLVSGTDNNWEGIEVRQQDKFNFYTFDISGDGYYEVLKFVDGQSVKLVKPTYSSYISKGAGKSNHLEVKCDGHTFSFSVSGQLLETVTDATYNTGTISLRALSPGSQTLSTEVKFDNFEICDL